MKISKDGLTLLKIEENDINTDGQLISDIPKNVMHIGEGAFGSYSCGYLRTITFSFNIISIDDFCFFRLYKPKDSYS